VETWRARRQTLELVADSTATASAIAPANIALDYNQGVSTATTLRWWIGDTVIVNRARYAIQRDAIRGRQPALSGLVNVLTLVPPAFEPGNN